AAMLVIAHDDKILTCNQAAATLFDYTSEELAGEPINRLIALRRDHRAIDELATAIARYRLSGDLAIGIRRNGSPFEIALSMA
ncbi:PAS domain-containing protein, partial [Enterococcus faecium]|uniref:PAS domain-containing protein n=3 Tax=Bacteria TaxID=2 RepID=UPI003F42E91C